MLGGGMWELAVAPICEHDIYSLVYQIEFTHHQENASICWKKPSEKNDGSNGIRKMVFSIVLKYLLNQAFYLRIAGLIIINNNIFVFKFVQWLVQ